MRIELDEVVYLVTDPGQKERMVTGILTRRDGNTYELSCGTEHTWHQQSEISKSINLVSKFRNNG